MHNFIISNLGYVIGAVMVFLPIPILIWNIPRNPWYGVRIPNAFTSDENWKTINTYGAKVLVFWGSLCIIASFILNIYVENFKHTFYLHQILSVVFLIIAVIQILLFSSKV